ncbi:UNVERIFIED_CONTAM: hypothetical protein Sindi_1709000 [Sesamum indicum]
MSSSSLQTLAGDLGDGEGGTADAGTVVEGGGRRQGTATGVLPTDARLSFMEARDIDSKVNFNFEEFFRLANRVVDGDKDSMDALNNLKTRWESKFGSGELERQQATPMIRKAWRCLLTATTELLAGKCTEEGSSAAREGTV